jgi:hypothetical protein
MDRARRRGPPPGGCAAAALGRGADRRLSGITEILVPITLTLLLTATITVVATPISLLILMIPVGIVVSCLVVKLIITDLAALEDGLISCFCHDVLKPTDGVTCTALMSSLTCFIKAIDKERTLGNKILQTSRREGRNNLTL